jgi:hypothetical protein
MAAKKVIKLPAKKPAAKKVVARKLAIKLPAKKPAAKVVARKLAIKLPAKKPAAKVVARKAPLARRPQAKVAAKPIAKPAAKKSALAEGVSTYRTLRKYTVPKLRELLADRPADETAVKFVRYVAGLESQMPDWKAKRLPPPDGKPRKRGRPSKEELAKREGKVVAAAPAKAADAIAKAKAGGIVPPPRFAVATPKTAPAPFRPPAPKAAPKPVFRLPGLK